MADDFDHLSPLAKNVLFNEGTERPFTSELLDEKRAGTYACAACGNPLFHSSQKFDSGTGWPSFDDPIDGTIETKVDYKLGVPRTEYHCADCGGHLGHIFEDGPTDTGQRYCNNGAALKFIPDKEPNLKGTVTAYFAGGCFWCIETDIELLDGVRDVTSGYSGGSAESANYDAITTGKTKHREAIKVAYNPNLISYQELVTQFMKHIDPFDAGGQQYDRGYQYTTAIYTQNEEEAKIAQDTLDVIAKTHNLKREIATVIEPYKNFYKAEEHHQDYSTKSPTNYKRYRKGSGRDAALKKIWGE